MTRTTASCGSSAERRRPGRRAVSVTLALPALLLALLLTGCGSGGDAGAGDQAEHAPGRAAPPDHQQGTGRRRPAGGGADRRAERQPADAGHRAVPADVEDLPRGLPPVFAPGAAPRGHGRRPGRAADRRPERVRQGDRGRRHDRRGRGHGGGARAHLCGDDPSRRRPHVRGRTGGGHQVPPRHHRRRREAPRRDRQPVPLAHQGAGGVAAGKDFTATVYVVKDKELQKHDIKISASGAIDDGVDTLVPDLPVPYTL